MSPKERNEMASSAKGNFFGELFAEVEKTDEYYIDGLKIEVAEQIYNLMEQQNINQTELGNKLGVDRTYISRILKGNVNLTLETMAKIACRLSATWDLKLNEKVKKEPQKKWENKHSPGSTEIYLKNTAEEETGEAA